MSRNGFSPAYSRKNPAPRWSSHLRQPSRNSSDDGNMNSENNGDGQHQFYNRSNASSTPPRSRSPDTMSSNSTIREHSFHKIPPTNTGHTCTVTINEAYARDEVLLNLNLFDDSIQPGQLMAIDVLPDQRANYNSMRRSTATGRKEDLSSSVIYTGSVGNGDNASTYGGSTTAGTDTASNAGQPDLDSGRRYLFIVKDMSKETKARHSTVQIFVAKRIADVFGMKKGSTVLLTHVDASNPAVEASHVELVFKDQYLSRADMWRLAVSELSERTIYRGQMVLFMSTIKATVTHVFVDGKQVQSAFFGKNTRPIFRSESARFVLFIQMAREMWDFDSDCSGEIIFSKVVNGLLPALFKKWAARKVKHLVTIVLFARVEYDTGLTVDLSEASMQHDYYTGVQSLGNKRPYKDFYRVVVSEMSSGEWTRILYQLKREFNIFRRDISLHHLSHLRPDTAASTSDDPYNKSANSQKYQHIQAESSSAMHGNVLEAINMASTLFSHDYVDRDLMRTGISVVVITPGSGVFEVEYDALRRTTEALIGNGIGIDLICVPRVPLHYAPLFRFRNPQFLDRDFMKSRAYSNTSHGTSQGASQRGSHGGLGANIGGSTPKQSTPIYGSYSSIGVSSFSPGKSEIQRAYEAMSADRFTDTWIYALPQWLHVSYWATEPGELLTRQGVPPPPIPLEGMEPGKHLEEFAVRCRMYDLQMRGVLETNEIETTPLHMDPLFPRSAFKQSSRSSTTNPVSTNGVFSIVSKTPSNVLYDPVIGFKTFGEKLARMDNKSVWKQLQDYDTTRQKLPTTRRGPTHAPSYRRDLEEGNFASGLISGPSTLRKQNYLGAGGPGALDSGNQSLHVDRRSSTASYMSTTGQAGPSILIHNVPGSQGTLGATPTSALTSSRGLTYNKGARDVNRSVSFDKVSIASSHSTSSKMPKAMRQISLGKKGFGIAAPKAVAAEVNVQAVSASGLNNTSAFNVSMPPKPPSTPNRQYPSTPTTSAFASDGRFSPVPAPQSGFSSADRSYRQGLGMTGTVRSIGGGGSSTDLRRLAETPTRPIAIRGPDGLGQMATGSFLGAGLAGRADRGTDTDERDNRFTNAARVEDVQRVYNSKLLAEAVPEVTKALSPIAAMAPWLMIMNPSKPEVNKMDSVTFNSRWQHVFPRPGEIRAMRWKVMCSPASVPLTTEYFPTRAQFETEFQQQPYSVSQADEDMLPEVPQTRDDLLRELISLRLSQGFQVVVGPVVAKAFGQKQMKIADIFSTEQPFEDGTSIFMSIGNTIHQLSFANTSEVQVNIYQRKTDAFNGGVRPQGDAAGSAGAAGNSSAAPMYRPAIRTLLDRDYNTTMIDISAPRTERNWNYIDSYLAGHGEQLTESLRFWRARFVLIPIPTPKSANNSNSASTANNATGATPANAPASNPNRPGDNDEEIRIEGIRKLGQLWQKHRVVPASERSFLQTSLSARQPRRWHRDIDQNPLDVVYKTEDPSLVIAAELESTLPLLDGSGGMVPRNKSQLVTDRDQFRRDSINLAALAEAIQQPVEQGGIRMQNRRWHLRLHYSCFIGSDMTTWLLDNVDDLESREEAEDLGNWLMVSDKDSAAGNSDGGAGTGSATGGVSSSGANSSAKESAKSKGIFVHVERRHPFRDGQYFYQISSEYARPHSGGVGSWFNARKAAPMTPVLDAHREGVATGASGNNTSAATADGPRVPASRPASVHEDNNVSGVPPSGASTPVMSAVGAGGTGSNTNTLNGPNKNKRTRVTLSKMMKYDVDHRKRSYRPERIDLHYDRLHNPDNCYHIRIEWMNATAKLIEDAVEVWAREAYQHGLRLVEVPIAEASAISEVNPLRRPYKVQLSRAPPTERPATYFDGNSLAPQAQPGRHFYQKAILRRFGFVLDTEAASNFPPSVDVQYSWGRPSYKFTQYIHRSGVILAQINDEGNFILLVNRLYSNRSVAPSAREQMRNNNDQNQAQNSNQNVAPSDVNPLQSPMVKSSMFNSPRLRPTGGLEALKQVGSSSLLNKATSAAGGPGPGTSPIVTNNGNGVAGAGVAAGSLGTVGTGAVGSMPVTAASAVLFPITALGLPPGDDPESVMDDLEAFCQDGDALEAFYAEVLEKRAAAVRAGAGVTGIPGPGPFSHTGVTGAAGAGSSSGSTPSTRAFSGSTPTLFAGGSGTNPSALATAAARATAEVPDTNIPDLGLPPGLLHNSGLGSPRMGANGSSTLRSPPPPLHHHPHHPQHPHSHLQHAHNSHHQQHQPHPNPHHHNQSQHHGLGGPPVTPVRTTSPGFLASRLFLRRGSVDDVALQNAQNAQGGQNQPHDGHE